MLGRLFKDTDDDSQRDYWESELGHREVHHPIVRGFSEQRWEYLAAHLPMSEITSALDVGCGNGFSTAGAPRHIDFVGCDGAMAMLTRHPGSRLAQVDAQQLPFAADTFDLVFCWELLHHVEQPWRVIAEMARVSRRYVLVMEPNPLNLAQALFALYDPEHRWVLRYSKRYFVGQIERAGLDVAHYARGGLIFPNKCPEPIYPLLRAMPYRLPFIGISQWAVATKR